LFYKKHIEQNLYFFTDVCFLNNLSGRVLLQQNTNLQPQINLDVSDLEPNVYFVIAQGEDYHQVKKMVLVK